VGAGLLPGLPPARDHPPRPQRRRRGRIAPPRFEPRPAPAGVIGDDRIITAPALLDVARRSLPASALTAPAGVLPLLIHAQTGYPALFLIEPFLPDNCIYGIDGQNTKEESHRLNFMSDYALPALNSTARGGRMARAPGTARRPIGESRWFTWVGAGRERFPGAIHPCRPPRSASGRAGARRRRRLWTDCGGIIPGEPYSKQVPRRNR
jgi:hypothetical protein